MAKSIKTSEVSVRLNLVIIVVDCKGGKNTGKKDAQKGSHSVINNGVKSENGQNTQQ